MIEIKGNKKCFYSGLWCCLFVLLTMQSLHAQFTISEDFRGGGNPEIIIGDHAYLTSGNGDPVGAGWLRLTKALQNQKGYAYINKSFPSRLGVLVDFEYTMWRDVNDGANGADGFTIFLFDAKYGPETFRLGAYGGSLGYANSTNNDPKLGGLSGGYLGIGFDAYGNFAAESENKNGGSIGESPNSIVLRGPTTSSSPTDINTNKYLKGVTLTEDGTIHDATLKLGDRSEDVIDYNTTKSTRPTQEEFYRRVQAEVLPIEDGKFKIIVRWATDYGGEFKELLTYITDEAPPELLKLGFAAATGGSVNYHEIRNMLVSTPGNLRVRKLASKDLMRSVPGDNADNEISFTLEVTNDTATDLSEIEITDQFTDGSGDPIPPGMFVITDIIPENFIDGIIGLPSFPIQNGSFNGMVGLLANSTGTIAVKGYLNGKIPSGNLLNNTVTVSNDVITDLDEENNISKIGIPVLGEDVDIIIEKTTEKYCLDKANGHDFTIRVRNIGTSNASHGFQSTITVKETFPIGVVPIKISLNGWSMNNTGNVYTFTRKIDGIPISSIEIPPIAYNITNSNSFETTSEVKLTNSSNENIEPSGNRDNNTVMVLIADQPAIPKLVNSTIYYCQGDSASSMDSYVEEANSGNTLLWYTTRGGSSLSVVPTPDTSTAGSTTYYVSQSNGNCESELTEVKVIVLEKPTAGSIGGGEAICAYNTPGEFTNEISGTVHGSEELSYRWEYSEDNGTTWLTVSGQENETFQPGPISTETQFRRITIADSGNILCESVPSNVITVTIKRCMVLSNPSLPSNVNQ